MKQLFLIGGLCLALAACQDDTPSFTNTGELPPVGSALLEQQKAACEKSGGTFGRGGAQKLNICFQTPRDASKSCRSNADCTGPCLAQSRTCAPIVPFFGCHDVLVAPGQRVNSCLE